MPDLTGERKLLLFSVGPVACCADSLTIHRIIAPPEHLVHLPSRTHHPSIFRHESRLVSVLDVRALFGLAPESKRQSNEKLIIAEIEGSLFGFWIDAVQTIISDQDGKWRLLPAVVPPTLFDAAFNYREQLVLHIDFQTLIHASAVPWVHNSGLYPVDEAPEEIEAENKEPSRTEPITTDDKKSAEEQKPVSTPRSGTPPPYKSPRVHQPIVPRSSPVIKPYSKEGVKSSSAYSPAYSPPAKDKTEKPVSHSTAKKAVRSELPVRLEPSKPDGIPEYFPEPLERQALAGPLMVWLLLLGLSFGMLLYYLWPQAETHTAKKTVQVVKPLNRELPKFVQVEEPVIEEPVIEEPIKMAVPEAFVREVMTVEDSQESEKFSAGLSEGQTESSSSELSKDLEGPHASIEREGNMVTITLREGALSDEMTAVEEPYAIDPETETQVDSPVAARSETVDLKDEVLIAGPSDPIPGSEISMVNQQASSSSIEPKAEIADADRSAKIKPSAPVTAREIIYVVVRGDTLWDIARRYIHDPFRYPELARLSNIQNPDLIYPGDRVRILIIRH